MGYYNVKPEPWCSAGPKHGDCEGHCLVLLSLGFFTHSHFGAPLGALSVF